MKESTGAPLDRVDGHAKVTGTAPYAAEYALPNLAHAVLVTSTIARGTVERVDAAAARAAPGVIAVLSPEHPPKYASDPRHKRIPQERVLHAFQTRRVEYQQQPVALVVADSFQRATHAAALVKIEYRAHPPEVDFDAALHHAYRPDEILGKEPDSEYGEAPKQAAAVVEETYETPYETHNPMEPHATTAVWDDAQHLTVYDSTQGVFNVRQRLSDIFGLPPENVHVVSKFIGGGFGCKGSPWDHVVLAALAARAVKRPVRLVLARQQMFGPVGFRPRTRQKVRLAADANGKLLELRHDTTNATSLFDEFTEPSAMAARMLYASGHIVTSHRLVRLSIGTPTFMRAPGEASGSFALESALDELAARLKLDPIELRLRNHADMDPETGHPWSSKSLRACYQQAAQRFGWSRRSAAPGSMRDGRALVGWGMATATYPARQIKASALARLLPDGRAEVLTGSQDLGTGTYTVMAQVAADALGLPVDRVRVDLGDTQLPQAPLSAGSMTAATVGSAVKLAAEKAKANAIALAVADPDSPLHGHAPAEVQVKDGMLQAGAAREPYEALIRRKGLATIEARIDSEPAPDRPKYSTHAFGAQFAEVRIDPDLGELRVSRWAASFGVGKVLNAKTAHSQLVGGIVWGIGMALLEHSVLDPKTGRFINHDLSDYHLPVSPDVPEIDVTFVDEVDPHASPVGAKGLGEIGITGACAAIANAVFHATGKRVRQLPITLDQLI